MPRTLARPPASTRSAALTSSRAAASASTRSRTRRAAPSAAPLDTMAPRLAKVPLPAGATSVSGCRTVTRSRGTPSRSATSWATVVPWPCPWVGKDTSQITSPCGGHAHGRRLVARHVHHAPPAIGPRADAGRLRVAGDAHADQASLGPLGRLLRAPRFVLGPLEGVGEGSGKVAAVVDEARGGGEGIALARNQVAAADLGGVEAEPGGQEVERPLHGEGAHGHAHPAIGAERRLVGGDRDRMPLVGGRRGTARAGYWRCPAARAPG